MWTARRRGGARPAGVCQVPEYLKLSDEIGDWAGDIKQAELPDEFLVDYVRVYDLADKLTVDLAIDILTSGRGVFHVKCAYIVLSSFEPGQEDLVAHGAGQVVRDTLAMASVRLAS